MSEYKPRIITPGKMIRTPSGQIARCPAFQSEYSLRNCCCFLDPNPPEWDSEKSYPQFYAVKHSGNTWYSVIVGNNQGNEPGVGAGWSQYTHCNNSDWDSISPFGGVGRSPEYYGLSYEKSVQSWGLLHDISNYPCSEIGSCTQIGKSSFFVVMKHSLNPCQYGASVLEGNYKSEFHVSGSYTYGGVTYDEPYGGYYPWKEDWIPLSANIILSTYTRPRIAIGAPSTWSPVLTYGESSMLQHICGYPASRPINGEVIYLSEDEAEECILFGSVSKTTLSESRFTSSYSVCFPVWGDKLIGTHHEMIRVSWRPLDCDYELWNPEKEYFKDDCVAWLGRFYRACKPPRGGGVILEGDININREPEEDASNTCEFGFFWRLA